MSMSTKRTQAIDSPWSPRRMPSLRFFAHAAAEAAALGLVPGRTVEDRFERAADASPTGLTVAETGQTWQYWTGAGFGVGLNSTNEMVAYPTNTTDGAAVINSGLLNAVVRCVVRVSIAAGRYRAVVVRGLDANNYLMVGGSGDTTFTELRKIVGGVSTTLATGATVLTDAQFCRYRVELSGNAINVYLNNVLEISYTLAGGDATQFGAAGATWVGLGKRGSSAVVSRSWDSFRVDPPGTTAMAAQVTDQSGLGFHATQATASKRAIVLHDGTRWVYRSDGIDDIYTGDPNISTALSGIVVVGTPGLADVARVCTCFASGSSTDQLRRLEIGMNNNKVQILQRNNDTIDELISTTTSLTALTPYVNSYISTGAAYQLRVNRVAQTLSATTGANTGDWFGDTASRMNFSLFARLLNSNEANFCAQDLATLIVADGAVSAADIARLERWVNQANRMGLAI